MELGRYAAALSDFTTHVGLGLNGPDKRSDALSGLLNRGRVKYLIGDFAGAISDLTEATALELRPVYSPLFRGRARLALGDFDGAIADFSTAIESFPELTNAFRHRAEAREQTGDHQGGRDDRSQYERLGGRDLPAYELEPATRRSAG